MQQQLSIAILIMCKLNLTGTICLILSEIPEDDSLRQVSTIPAPEPKKAIHVSYKALPSVPKPGKNLAKHRHHHQDKRRKVHLLHKCKPQTQFSYVPTPLSQLSNTKKEAKGGIQENESSAETSSVNERKKASDLPNEDAVDCGIDITSSKSFETEKQQLNAGDRIWQDSAGYGGSNEKEEESRDGDIIADVNSMVTGGHRFSIPKEVPPTFQEPPVENVMLADSGCYNEFVALQKQEINRIEAQLAELAKQKELAERSIALAEGGDTDGESVPRLESSPAIRTPLSPTFMPDKIKGVSYSHDASAESASSGPDYDDRVPLQDDLEYDPLSNYTAATTTSNDIKAFIRHVRRKSSERQSSLASSSYEPTPVNSLNISAVTDEGLNSEPEGTFSSGEENETGNEARDLPDDESGDDVHSEGGEEEKEEEQEEDGGGEDESHLKSMDSGFSESCKGANEADRVENAKSKVAADKGKTKVKDNHKISSEMIMKSDDTSLSPQDKKRKFKLKVDEKFSNDKKSVSKEDKLKKINGKESLDSVDCTRKRKLSAGDLSSFFQKRKSNKLDGNTSSESLLTSKEDVKVQSLKKIEKLTKQKSQSTERNITSDISTSKDKTVTKKPQNAVLSENSSRKVDHTVIKKSQKQGKPFLAERKRSSDSSSGSNVDKTSVKKTQTLSSSEKQLHSKPKLSKNSSKVEPKKQVKIHKSTSVMQKGRPSNRLHQVSPKADNAKAKLSQLFGEDSSDDEEEVVEVNDSFAVSSDSDFDQDRRRESADVIIPKRSGTSASKVVSKNRVERHSKEAYDISSDSSASKNSSLSNQHGKMEKKRTITKPRHGKYVKGVESSGMHEKRSSISKNSTNQKNHVEKKKKPPPGEFFRSCMGIRETEEVGNYVHDDSDASSDEVILITEDDEVQSPPKKIKKKPLSLDKQRPSTSNPSRVSKSEKVLSSKTPRPDKTNDSQRSRQSEVKKEPKDVSSSDEDFFVPVEEFDNEALFCDSDDLQDEDAYEECLQIFKENWNMIPQSEQKKRALVSINQSSFKVITGQTLKTL